MGRASAHLWSYSYNVYMLTFTSSCLFTLIVQSLSSLTSLLSVALILYIAALCISVQSLTQIISLFSSLEHYHPVSPLHSLQFWQPETPTASLAIPWFQWSFSPANYLAEILLSCSLLTLYIALYVRSQFAQYLHVSLGVEPTLCTLSARAQTLNSILVSGFITFVVTLYATTDILVNGALGVNTRGPEPV